LLEAVEQKLGAGRRTFTVELSGEALGLLHKLYEMGEVLGRNDTAEGTTVAEVRVPADRESAFRKAFPDARAA
jgi:hypothetical protein